MLARETVQPSIAFSVWLSRVEHSTSAHAEAQRRGDVACVLMGPGDAGPWARGRAAFETPQADALGCGRDSGSALGR